MTKTCRRRERRKIRNEMERSVTGVPQGFGHGHLEFYHANPSIITLPGSREMKHGAPHVCTVLKRCRTQKCLRGLETRERRTLGSKHVSKPSSGTSSSDQLPSLFPMASTWTQNHWQMGHGKMKRCPCPYLGEIRYNGKDTRRNGMRKRHQREIRALEFHLRHLSSTWALELWRDWCQTFQRHGF